MRVLRVRPEENENHHAGDRNIEPNGKCHARDAAMHREPARQREEERGLRSSDHVDVKSEFSATFSGNSGYTFAGFRLRRGQPSSSTRYSSLAFPVSQTFLREVSLKLEEAEIPPWRSCSAFGLASLKTRD